MASYEYEGEVQIAFVPEHSIAISWAPAIEAGLSLSPCSSYNSLTGTNPISFTPATSLEVNSYSVVLAVGLYNTTLSVQGA